MRACDHFNTFQGALVVGALTEQSAGKQVTMSLYSARMLPHILETGGGDLELQDLHMILAGLLVLVARTADSNKCSMRDIALTAIANAELPQQIDYDIAIALSVQNDDVPEQRRPYDQRLRPQPGVIPDFAAQERERTHNQLIRLQVDRPTASPDLNKMVNDLIDVEVENEYRRREIEAIRKAVQLIDSSVAPEPLTDDIAADERQGGFIGPVER